jgi:transcription initiation factor TFIIIB Brf1 subunit/transcription initiation factor TFIIB
MNENNELPKKVIGDCERCNIKNTILFYDIIEDRMVCARCALIIDGDFVNPFEEDLESDEE